VILEIEEKSAWSGILSKSLGGLKSIKASLSIMNTSGPIRKFLNYGRLADL